MVQGPALLQVMESPDDLRTALDCLERATDLLASIERCRYPGQASRTHSKAKQSKAKRSATTPALSAPAPAPQDPAEQLRTRILSFVERWWEKEGRGATMREIRNPNRTVSPDDVTEMVSILVHEGKLQAIPVKRTVQYAPFGMVPVQTKKSIPITRLILDGREVGVYIVVLQCSADYKVESYVVNRVKHIARWGVPLDFLPAEDQDLVFIKGSKGFEVVEKWVLGIDFDNRYYDCCSEPLTQDGDKWVP